MYIHSNTYRGQHAAMRPTRLSPLLPWQLVEAYQLAADAMVRCHGSDVVMPCYRFQPLASSQHR